MSTKPCSLILLNVQGFNPGANSRTKWKIHAIKNDIKERSKNSMVPAVIALTETHLKPHITKAQLTISNYDHVRSDRLSRKDGGVLLYVHKDIPITNSDTFDNSVCEAVTFSSSVRNSLVIGAYRPPDASLEEFKEMLFFIQKCINENEPHEVTVMGDFNFPNINWSDKSIKRTTLEKSDSAEIFLEFLDKNFLSLFVNKPTRMYNTLDLIFSNGNEIIANVSSEKTELSDHNYVEVPITPNHKLSFIETNPTVKPPQGFRALSLAQANFGKINHSLSEIDWESLKSSCTSEEFPEVLNKTVLEICSKHCPKKSRKPQYLGRYEQKCSLHRLNRAKRKLKTRLRAMEQHNPNSPQLPDIRKQIGTLCLQISDAAINKVHLEEDKVVKNIQKNPKKFFSYVKTKSKTKSLISLLIDDNNEVITGNKEMVDCFQDFFTSVFSDPHSSEKRSPDFNPPVIKFPLETLTYSLKDIEEAIDCIDSSSSCPEWEIPAPVLKYCKKQLCVPIKMIWDDSLETGVIPKHYKIQFVAPIHKKESTVFARNYRPISITSHVIKIFERVIRNHLINYLESNSIINPNQHGFRKGKSCLTQLLAHYDELLQNALNGRETDVIYIDFAKAFDKIDHEILLRKLSLYGISGNLYKWLENFLMDRHQYVALNGELSYIAQVLSGVPQGTVLGPILFLIYVNDLASNISDSTCRFFADDTRLSKAISVQSDSALLQIDLDTVSSWSTANNMQLNEDKYEYLTHGIQPSNIMQHLPFHMSYYPYQTSSGYLSPVSLVKDLGFSISKDLSWSNHIAVISATATKKAAWVLNTFSDRRILTMMTLYKSLIRSHLENGCPLWNPQSISDITKLEVVQKNFISKIYELRNLDYWEKLEKLNLRSLQRRRERYCLVHMWKIVNNIAPNDLCFEFYSNARRGIKASLKPILQANSKYQTLRDNSFAHVGPKLWNLLPKDASEETSLSVFKISLSKFLEKYPDKPPVPGLTYVNNNSILNYPRFL